MCDADVEQRYKAKLAKYDEVDDELDEILFKEAMYEAACASYLNGGRKTREYNATQRNI